MTTTDWQSRLTRYQAMLETAYTAYEAALEDNLASYELDTNEGQQKAVQRRIDRLSREINRLESMEEWICNKLNNKGIVSMRLRRKP